MTKTKTEIEEVVKEEQEVLFQSPSSNTKDKEDGIWIGIDFGTSNCACAVWDSNGGRAKVLRLGHGLTKKQNTKIGRIVPSALLFSANSNNNNNNNDTDSSASSMTTNQQKSWEEQENIILNHWQQQSPSGTTTKTVQPHVIATGYQAIATNDREHIQTAPSTALITSVKRIVGMTTPEQLQQLFQDSKFLQSLPFDVVLEDNGRTTNDGAEVVIQVTLTNDGDDNHNNSEQQVLVLKPIQIVALLLNAIRQEALLYLKTTGTKKRLGIPIVRSDNDSGDEQPPQVRNCVVGVPAHYGQYQRQFMKEACQLAGFTGHVSTLTESTAAAMAYGLFVSPTSATTRTTATPELLKTSATTSNNTTTRDGDNDNPNDEKHEKDHQKNILVFDMGGGTTDVTIATMSSKQQQQQQQPAFQVAVTQGDSRLGGDDMDQALYTYVWGKSWHAATNNNPNENPPNPQKLIQKCKRAKEELCGTFHDPPAPIVTIDVMPYRTTKKNSSTSIQVTQEEFNQSIESLVDQAKSLVERTVQEFESLQQQQEHENSNTTKDVKDDVGDTTNHRNRIHEVVLVGGTTRVPAIRQMLQVVFPHIQELCCSLSPEGAVAQGAAIQAAALSGVVPVHTLRSALMLDTVPHTIGVSIPTPNAQGASRQSCAFVPIIPKDAPLPAKGYATFVCGDTRGVTVHAVEDVSDFTSTLLDNNGDDKQELQPLGEFTFMLHRLSSDQWKALGDNNPRKVDIGMTLETNGQFIVSIYDSHDPEHVRKKQRYQQEAQTQKQKGDLQSLKYNDDPKKQEHSDDETTMEQIGLMILLCLLFVLYLGVKIAFSEPGNNAQIL